MMFCINITKAHHSLNLLACSFTRWRPYQLSIRRNYWISCTSPVFVVGEHWIVRILIYKKRDSPKDTVAGNRFH